MHLIIRRLQKSEMLLPLIFEIYSPMSLVYVYGVNGGEIKFEEELFLWIINNASKSI